MEKILNMNNKIRYFTEYESEKIDFKFPSLFFERGYCEKNKDNTIKFKIVGFIEFEGFFYVIFPKGMSKSSVESENKKNASVLLKVLKKYLSSSYLEDSEALWNSQHNNPKFFKVIEWLIQDYKVSGLMKRNQKVIEVNGNGRIEWNKTIKKSNPIITSNNSVVYMDLLTSKNRNHADAEIIQIHKYVLNDIKLQYGSIFGFKFHDNTVIKKPSTSYLIYKLKKSLASTNIDREIYLQKNLIAYLSEKSNANEMHIYATPFFANIWEAMCRHFLQDEESIRNMLPKPYWNFMGSERPSTQIPDILTTNKDSIFIFDAKYYQVLKGIDKLPGWKDIVKQFFYALSLKKTGKTIYNVFLFPGTFSQRIYEYMGYASVKENQEEASEIFGYILGIGVDVTYLSNIYIRSTDSSLRQEIHDLAVDAWLDIKKN